MTLRLPHRWIWDFWFAQRGAEVHVLEADPRWYEKLGPGTWLDSGAAERGDLDPGRTGR